MSSHQISLLTNSAAVSAVPQRHSPPLHQLQLLPMADGPQVSNRSIPTTTQAGCIPPTIQRQNAQRSQHYALAPHSTALRAVSNCRAAAEVSSGTLLHNCTAVYTPTRPQCSNAELLTMQNIPLNRIAACCNTTALLPCCLPVVNSRHRRHHACHASPPPPTTGWHDAFPHSNAHANHTNGWRWDLPQHAGASANYTHACMHAAGRQPDCGQSQGLKPKLGSTVSPVALCQSLVDGNKGPAVTTCAGLRGCRCRSMRHSAAPPPTPATHLPATSHQPHTAAAVAAAIDAMQLSPVMLTESCLAANCPVRALPHMSTEPAHCTQGAGSHMSSHQAAQPPLILPGAVHQA
jgi:hypothetical protein